MKISELLAEAKTKIPAELASEFATAYVKIHNQTAKQYTAAFKKVGARMWRDDVSHPLKKDNIEHIASMVEDGYTDYNLSIPLTVLDSYPDVTSDQRASLKKEVAAIQKTNQETWIKEKKRLLGQ